MIDQESLEITSFHGNTKIKTTYIVVIAENDLKITENHYTSKLNVEKEPEDKQEGKRCDLVRTHSLGSVTVKLEEFHRH